MPLRKSKKSSKKPAPISPPPPPPQEELPQVWLPDQAITHHDMGEEEEEAGEFSFEGEQEQLASYLEREQSNEPVGWEEEEELDYTQIATTLGINIESQNQQAVPAAATTESPQGSPAVRIPIRPSLVRPALKDCESVDGALEEEMEETIQPLQEDMTTASPRRSRLPSIRSPGSELQSETHSLFNYVQSSIYGVNELGQIRDVSNDWSGDTMNDPNSLLKLIEHTQRRGLIPWSSQPESERILVMSKYGIKVTDTKRQRVYIRHTLHKILTVVHFIDTRGQSLLAVKVLPGSEEEEEEEETNKFNLFLYQCQSENQATEICIMLGQIFEAILNKMKLEDNLSLLR